MDYVLCARCKGKGLCGLRKCPLLAKIREVRAVTDRVKTDFFGSSPPSVFVGRTGYPDISMGALAPAVEGDTSGYDDPRGWISKGYEIGKIFDLRSSLVNSYVRTNVKKKTRFLDSLQDIALASKPLDIEAKYDNPLRANVDVYSRSAPTGPSASMNRLQVCDNPKVPSSVEKAVYDTDLLANDAIIELDSKRLPENSITKLLSIGLLGEEKNRKLVPTRWAITATDDMISKKLIDEIRHLDEVDRYLVFSAEYLGNHFEILVMPGNWSFECIEATLSGSMWNRGDSSPVIHKDYEKYEGRKDYASNVAGGYYATRLPITKQMAKRKIQASVLSIREISEEYSLPLGVWVVRETVRKAMSSRPASFNTFQEAVDYMDSRLRLGFEHYKNISSLIKDIKCQMRLTRFMRKK